MSNNDEYITIVDISGYEYTISAYQNLITKPNGIAIHVNTPELSAGGNDFYIKAQTETKSLNVCSEPTYRCNSLDLLGTEQSLTNYSGKANTINIINDHTTTYSYTSPALSYCTGETLTFGGKTRTGFMASAGQIKQISLNISSINTALSLINGYQLNQNDLLTSTHFSGYYWITGGNTRFGFSFRIINVLTGNLVMSYGAMSSGISFENHQVIAVF